MTFKEIIKKVLTNEWRPGYEFASCDTIYGWIDSSAERHLRELSSAGEIKHKLIGKYVHYRKNQELKLF